MTESVAVGRKTPGDGKLEVSRDFATALGGDGAKVQVRLHGRDLTGGVNTLECTCAKASAGGKHEHHFLQCDAFREFDVGTDVYLTAHEAHVEVVLAA